jgi:hypothetical protein
MNDESRKPVYAYRVHEWSGRPELGRQEVRHGNMREVTFKLRGVAFDFQLRVPADAVAWHPYTAVIQYRVNLQNTAEALRAKAAQLDARADEPIAVPLEWTEQANRQLQEATH